VGQLFVRILLAQNSLYYPAHGGGDKSNRLLIEALRARGHICRVVARISVFGEREQASYIEALAARAVTPRSTANGIVVFERAGVEVHVVTGASLRAHFAAQAEEFAPDVILASTDDPAQLLLETALRHPTARVVYLARATLALPFGPDCAFPSEAKTARIRSCDGAVGVSQYVAGYMRRHASIDAVHVPISLLEPGDWPPLGDFHSEFVTFVNPCAVKGIAIFLALADAFPNVDFAAVPTWGTNSDDRAALAARPNVHLLAPVDDIDQLLARTRVLLVPSLWAEARSRIVLEALLRGVPVMASDIGGIPEAMMGVPYLLPVHPIERYQTRLDEQMVPVAEVPVQDVAPWRNVLARLTTDAAHHAEISRQSRQAALGYAAGLHAGHFEAFLGRVERRDRAHAAAPSRNAIDGLSDDKRRLLGLRLRRQAAPSAWFPNAGGEGNRLFCFPHAGGGSRVPATVPGWTSIGIRLPGRESRLAETPFERMAPLVAALADHIAEFLDRPFAFFGHSMGAAIAFELTRELRRRGQPMPAMLIASGARAPQFRRNHIPPPAPSREAFLEELRRLQGIPNELLDDPAMMRAILPALEADAALYRNFVYSEDEPLPMPIRAYGGESDPNVHREHLEGWARQTAASFGIHVFPGGHFYLLHVAGQLAAALAEDLA
jgi:surfactin synthase thioesterase subunit/glycosyltransferase involved in cell wall biosynthesis